MLCSLKSDQSLVQQYLFKNRKKWIPWKNLFCFIKVETVTVCLSHQRQNIWYCRDIIFPLQTTGRRLISIRSMIRTGPRASAEVFVIPSNNDVCNRLVHQVGGHLAATADLSYYKKHKDISCHDFILETEQVKQRENFRLDASLSGWYQVLIFMSMCWLLFWRFNKNVFFLHVNLPTNEKKRSWRKEFSFKILMKETTVSLSVEQKLFQERPLNSKSRNIQLKPKAKLIWLPGKKRFNIV